MDAVTLATAKADARRRYPTKEHAGGIHGFQSLALDTITAAANGASRTYPLCARIPFPMHIDWFALHVQTAIASSDTNYWTFTLRRGRPTQVPPATGAAMTNTNIGALATNAQASGGLGITAALPYHSDWRAWDDDAATCDADDNLCLVIGAIGAPTTLDRLTVTWAYQEVSA